jgi:hypothetical protein
MKKLLAVLLMMLLPSSVAFADTPVVGGTTGVYTSSECNAAAYYAIGTLCQDTDDGKLYKGTGAAVEEIATGSTIATDTLWDAAGDLAYGTGANTAGRLAAGTAYQLLMMNSGATAPAWTSTLGVTGTRLTKGWFTDLEVTNLPTINGATLASALGTATFGAGAGMTWTFNASGGTDTTVVFGDNTWNITAGTITLTGNVSVTGSLTVAASASPTTLILDSDAPGTDKEIAKYVGAYIDGADGSENGTLDFYVHVAGTSTSYIQVDGKNAVIDLFANIVIADSKTLTFDESAADPNDADIALSATDGVFKIAAANGANNEDLTIDLDQTANTAIISTSTGVTDISLSAINLATTGNITGLVKVLSLSSSCTIGSDCDSTSVKIAHGGTILATAAITITLPEIVASPSATQVGIGASICVIARDASEALVVDPHANDSISLCNTGACTKDTAGDSVTATQAGAKICLMAVEADNWMDMGVRGTWTAN